MKLMTEVYCPRNEIHKMETELWNLAVKGNDLTAYAQRFQELILLCTKMVTKEEDLVEKFIGGLPNNIQGNVIATGPTRLQDAIRFANNLIDQKLKGYVTRNAKNKRRFDNEPRDYRVQQPPLKKQNVARAYTVGNNKNKGYAGILPLCDNCKLHHHGLCPVKCRNCKKVGHQARNCWASTMMTCYGHGGKGHIKRSRLALFDLVILFIELLSHLLLKAPFGGVIGKIWYDEYVHDLRSVESKFLAIVFDDTFTSKVTPSYEPTVSLFNDTKIDFIISFDESDDEDYTVIYDENSFSYKIISVNHLKMNYENDDDKVNMPSFPSPEPSTDDDIYNDLAMVEALCDLNTMKTQNKKKSIAKKLKTNKEVQKKETPSPSKQTTTESISTRIKATAARGLHIQNTPPCENPPTTPQTETMNVAGGKKKIAYEGGQKRKITKIESLGQRTRQSAKKQQVEKKEKEQVNKRKRGEKAKEEEVKKKMVKLKGRRRPKSKRKKQLSRSECKKKFPSRSNCQVWIASNEKYFQSKEEKEAKRKRKREEKNLLEDYQETTKNKDKGKKEVVDVEQESEMNERLKKQKQSEIEKKEKSRTKEKKSSSLKFSVLRNVFEGDDVSDIDWCSYILECASVLKVDWSKTKKKGCCLLWASNVLDDKSEIEEKINENLIKFQNDERPIQLRDKMTAIFKEPNIPEYHSSSLTESDDDDDDNSQVRDDNENSYGTQTDSVEEDHVQIITKAQQKERKNMQYTDEENDEKCVSQSEDELMKDENTECYDVDWESILENEEEIIRKGCEYSTEQRKKAQQQEREQKRKGKKEKDQIGSSSQDSPVFGIDNSLLGSQATFDLAVELTEDEKLLERSIFSTQEEEEEEVFNDNEHMILFRINIQSLALGIEIDTLVIDVYVSILNYEENFKMTNMKCHFFYTSMMVSGILEDKTKIIDKKIDAQYDRFHKMLLIRMENDVEKRQMEDVELPFFPIIAYGHYYLIVFNLKTEKLVIKDNNEFDATYEGKYKDNVDFVTLGNVLTYDFGLRVMFLPITLISGDDSTHDCEASGLGSCYACSDSLLLTPLCCDDIHEVTPSVSALAGFNTCSTIEHSKGFTIQRIFYLGYKGLKNATSLILSS
uniref:Reverse transcriptase domain-containing protein n=1 Tax=Tanacetum cinerariifolium TaxID=118510 RepID=A0A6L2KK62_TANCI|nr:reverse transcriptase domain-containing protein [Tanacetum cinerariifolium]